MSTIYQAKQEYYVNILCHEMREIGFFSKAKSILEIKHAFDVDEYEKKGRFRVDRLLMNGFDDDVFEKYSNVYENLSCKFNGVIPYHLSDDSDEPQEQEDKNEAMINRDLIPHVTISCDYSSNEKAHWTSIIASMDAKLNPFLHHE